MMGVSSQNNKAAIMARLESHLYDVKYCLGMIKDHPKMAAQLRARLQQKLDADYADDVEESGESIEDTMGDDIAAIQHSYRDEGELAA